MNKKTLRLLAFTTLLCFFYTSCSVEDNPVVPPQKQHTEAVNELIRICNENTEVRQLLEQAISQAAVINPDRRYNPAQSFDEFCDFVDRNIRCLPWDVMPYPAPGTYGQSLYGRVDQGIGYFWIPDGRDTCLCHHRNEGLRTRGDVACGHVADMQRQLDSIAARRTRVEAGRRDGILPVWRQRHRDDIPEGCRGEPFAS